MTWSITNPACSVSRRPAPTSATSWLGRMLTSVRPRPLQLFCYRAKTWLGALAAALGGLDTLVFAGGIGENSPEARRRICEGWSSSAYPGPAPQRRRRAADLDRGRPGGCPCHSDRRGVDDRPCRGRVHSSIRRANTNSES